MSMSSVPCTNSLGFPMKSLSPLDSQVLEYAASLDCQDGKGALRAPIFPEALVLSIIDLLDARLDQAWRVIDQGSADEKWTAYVPSLERQLYGWCPLEADVGSDKASRDLAVPNNARVPTRGGIKDFWIRGYPSTPQSTSWTTTSRKSRNKPTAQTGVQALLRHRSTSATQCE